MGILSGDFEGGLKWEFLFGDYNGDVIWELCKGI